MRPLETSSNEMSLKVNFFHSRNCIWNCCLQNREYLIQTSVCYKNFIFSLCFYAVATLVHFHILFFNWCILIIVFNIFLGNKFWFLFSWDSWLVQLIFLRLLEFLLSTQPISSWLIFGIIPSTMQGPHSFEIRKGQVFPYVCLNKEITQTILLQFLNLLFAVLCLDSYDLVPFQCIDAIVEYIIFRSKWHDSVFCIGKNSVLQPSVCKIHWGNQLPVQSMIETTLWLFPCFA